MWAFNTTHNFDTALVFTNESASPVTVKMFLGSAFELSGASPSHTSSTYYAGGSSNPVEAFFNLDVAGFGITAGFSSGYPSFGAFTVPANGSKSMEVYFQTNPVTNGDPQYGEKGWTLNLWYEEAGVVKSASLSRSCTLTHVTNSPVLVAAGYAQVPAGLTHAGLPSWGTITVGSAPPSGKITVNGATTNSVNGKRIEIVIDGQSVASVVKTADLDLEGNPIMTTVPPLVWETATPGDFVGGTLIIRMNGQIAFNEVITADGEGNFDITRSLAAMQMELGDDADDLITDPFGNELPVNDDETALMDTDAAGTSHVRPEPGPIPGTDPKTDTTQDSDGAGPNTGLSVMDHYRATRAAIEDAFKASRAGGSFNFGDWEKTAPGGGESADGKGFGQAFGGAFDAVGGSFGGKTLTLPVGPSDGIVIRHLMSNSSAAMVPPAGAATIRVVVLIIFTVLYFLTMVSIVRGAFAGK